MPMGSLTGSSGTSGQGAPGAAGNMVSSNYTIRNNGGTYEAYNNQTGVMDYSGAVLATVLTSVNTALGSAGGRIEFVANQTYVLAAKVALNWAVTLDFNGATLDITGLNDVAFDFNSGGTLQNTKYLNTGVMNVYAKGSSSNPNTMLARVDNVPDGVVFRDCYMIQVDNGFKIRGACYSAVVDHCNSWQALNGNFVNLEGYYAASVVYAPNHALITNCEVTADAASTGGAGVYIYSTTPGNNHSAEGAFVDHCWFEQVHYGVYTDAQRTTVDHCIFDIEDNNASYGIYLDANSSDPIISNNKFTSFTTGSYGIYNNEPSTSYAVIDGNRFTALAGYGIYSINDNVMAITGNSFTGSGAGFIAIAGRLENCSLTGNTFVGNYGSPAGIGIQLITASVYGCTIVGNTFWGLVSAIDCSARSAYYFAIGNNTFRTCTNGVLNAAGVLYSTLVANVYYTDVTHPYSNTLDASSISQHNIGV